MNTRRFNWEYQRLYERTLRRLKDAGLDDNEAHECAVARCIMRAVTAMRQPDVQAQLGIPDALRRDVPLGKE